jgi:hypothetical protein
LREATGATAGNLSVQIDKLSTAGYIRVEKLFSGKSPTNLPNHPTGFKAFEEYLEALKIYSSKYSPNPMRTLTPTAQHFCGYFFSLSQLIPLNELQKS